MSIASDIAANIAAQLARITIANGFQTDIGARVFRGRVKLEMAELPCVVLVEGDEKPLDEAGGSKLPATIKPASISLQQTFYVEGHVSCDVDHPNDAAHQIVADIKRAIFSGDRSFGGKVRFVRYAGRSINRREDGLPAIAAAIAFTVDYAEDLTNP